MFNNLQHTEVKHSNGGTSVLGVCLLSWQQKTRQLLSGQLVLVPVPSSGLMDVFSVSSRWIFCFYLVRHEMFWETGRTRTNEGTMSFWRPTCACGWRVLVSDWSQQKKSGIHRKDLIAVPAAIPASSPTATVPITSSKGSLWTTSWWVPTREWEDLTDLWFSRRSMMDNRKLILCDHKSTYLVKDTWSLAEGSDMSSGLPAPAPGVT